MHRTLRRAVGTAVCALALTTATGTAAHAGTQTAKDPRGDVEQGSISSRAAGKRVVDIISSTNRYQGDTLRMSITTTNLPAKNYDATWLIRAGEGRYLAYYSDRDGLVGFGFYPLLGLERRGGCSVDAAADREAATITMRVPATCIGGAETVRVAATTSRQIGEASRRIDDARRDGYDGEGGPKFGPALARS